MTLPLSLALDPQNSQHLCNYDAALAVPGGAVPCPASTIVGSAMVVTPLLSQPLTSKVYLVQGIRFSRGQRIRTLPSLLVPLRGQIALDLRARTSVDGASRLVTTFSTTPDAAVSKFTLQINGGPQGIIVITDRGRTICNSTQTTLASLGAQSGATQRAVGADGHPVREANGCRQPPRQEPLVQVPRIEAIQGHEAMSSGGVAAGNPNKRRLVRTGRLEAGIGESRMRLTKITRVVPTGAVAAMTVCAALASASSASAVTLNGDWGPFTRCPVDDPSMLAADGSSIIAGCASSDSPNGSIKIGNTTTPTGDSNLQFGLVENTSAFTFSLVSPAGGRTGDRSRPGPRWTVGDHVPQQRSGDLGPLQPSSVPVISGLCNQAAFR